MKNLIIMFFLLSFFCNYGQNKSENKFINKIEKQLLSKKILKSESTKKIGSAGGYEKITIYVKSKIPILVLKEVKEVKHLYLTNGNEEDRIKFITAKFYIVDWTKNNSIRTGKFIIVNQKNLEEEKITMPTDYHFEFNKEEIEEKIKNGL